VIIGAGYIGLEMADALTHRGLEITLIGRSQTVLATVDASFGAVVEETVRARGVRVESGTEVYAVTRDGGRLRVCGSRDLNIRTDLILVAVGVQPNALIGAKTGFQPMTMESRHLDHKAYHPGATELCLRVTGDCGTLLGAQIVGHWRSEVAKRIDIYASALFHGIKVEDLNDLDLSYTPPFSSPWDPVQMAAQDWSRAAVTRSASAFSNP